MSFLGRGGGGLAGDLGEEHPDVTRAEGLQPLRTEQGHEVEATGIHVEVDELTGVYKNTTRGIVALVFRCKPVGGEERTSSEATAVTWLTPDEVAESMSEVYALRFLDALDGAGPHVRSHDGKQLTPAR
ncbi:NUDIX hydrolase [Streptomyces bugieae]|uniref:NUDIX hydrolase n=1 Tax=Streptomyces bugieae TaxID=3098223 RepID=A0ABU7P206_9ACTN|nr:hypothetical protein [Streptomyces sp. DSM 41528]